MIIFYGQSSSMQVKACQCGLPRPAENEEDAEGLEEISCGVHQPSPTAKGEEVQGSLINFSAIYTFVHFLANSNIYSYRIAHSLSSRSCTSTTCVYGPCGCKPRKLPAFGCGPLAGMHGYAS